MKTVEQLHEEYGHRTDRVPIATDIERVYGFVEEEMLSLSKARLIVSCMINDYIEQVNAHQDIESRLETLERRAEYVNKSLNLIAEWIDKQRVK